jgi:hypothetical protein
LSAVAHRAKAEAIHPSARAQAWIASSLSLLAMTSKMSGSRLPKAARTRLRILAAWDVRGLLEFLAPSNEEGAGKTGCALHPRSRVQKQIENAHEHTGSAEAIRPSLRDGVTAYFELSLVTGLFCHHRSQAAEASLRTWRQHRGARTTRLRRPRALAIVVRKLRVHRIPPRVS